MSFLIDSKISQSESLLLRVARSGSVSVDNPAIAASTLLKSCSFSASFLFFSSTVTSQLNRVTLTEPSKTSECGRPKKAQANGELKNQEDEIECSDWQYYYTGMR